MIDKIHAKILSLGEKNIICQLGPIDLNVTANTQDFIVNQTTDIFIHFHWSTENGPTLFGFCSDEIRQTFKCLINCPKIGPSLAMQILGQISPATLIKLIHDADEKNLAKINGIGPKSAKNLISFLKYDQLSFLATDSKKTSRDKIFLDVKEALQSLGYYSGDVTKIINEIAKNDALSTFDQILRQALFLLQKL